MFSSPSKKRAHTGNELPFGPLTDTGIDEILSEQSSKKVCTEKSNSVKDAYLRRQKVATYAKSLKKKRALTKNLRSDSSRMPASAQQGMPNLTGALCYRISLLQSLIHQPRFVNWIIDYHQPEDCVSDSQEQCVSCSARLLTLEYWRGAQGKPELLKVLRRMNDLFKSLSWSGGFQSGQADPEEQFSWILKAMRRELPTSVFAHLDATHALVMNSSVICSKCGFTSMTDDHSEGSLSLPIQPRTKDGDVASYCQKYMIETVEDYKCEKCGDKSKKTRYQTIVHSPDLLLVQLKRFDYQGRKDNTPVAINTTLDLDKFRDTTKNHERLRYELTAMVKHSGSLGFGHYTCGAQGPDQDWYLFDDSTKQKSSLPALLGNSRFTPYLLFFQRRATL